MECSRTCSSEILCRVIAFGTGVGVWRRGAEFKVIFLKIYCPLLKAYVLSVHSSFCPISDSQNLITNGHNFMKHTLHVWPQLCAHEVLWFITWTGVFVPWNFNYQWFCSSIEAITLKIILARNVNWQTKLLVYSLNLFIWKSFIESTTIVGILTFMSRIKYNSAEHKIYPAHKC